MSIVLIYTSLNLEEPCEGCMVDVDGMGDVDGVVDVDGITDVHDVADVDGMFDVHCLYDVDGVA